MPRRKTAEGYVLDAVMQYLAAKKIFAMRMNSGAMKIDNRFLRFGSPGMADILAFVKAGDAAADCWDRWMVVPYWIEVKAPKGKQSEAQKAFQKVVEEEDHRYILARGIEDLERAGL